MAISAGVVAAVVVGVVVIVGRFARVGVELRDELRLCPVEPLGKLARRSRRARRVEPGRERRRAVRSDRVDVLVPREHRELARARGSRARARA